MSWARWERSPLVVRALKIARKIEKRRGGEGVTSPMVWAELNKQAKDDEELAGMLEAADPRWMGGVFSKSEWFRIGYTSDSRLGGSHGRPVAVWIRQPTMFDE